MENLYNTLLEQTSVLKDEFVSKTKDWADRYYDSLLEKRSWSESDWCDYFGLEPRWANPFSEKLKFLTFPSGFHNTSNAKRYNQIKNDIRLITSKTKADYLSLEVDKAVKHYESSIKKLHDRIIKKGLDLDKINVVTGRVGVNIETTLTDGQKTVRAWTIIAEGLIQRPHYRYLVK
jgi:hypothetical protein